jgi:anti-sigma B factor antagonist
VQIEHENGITILHVQGQVSDLGADALSAALDRVLEAGDRYIVFDMADVSYLCSTGLGQIMRAYRVVRDKGYVRIAGLQPLVADLFRLTKLDKLLKLYDTLDAAVAADSEGDPSLTVAQ